MARANFNVIIVGGGPVGLVAAHMLSKADIDFIVLEKHHTVTPEPGSGIGLWPHTIRILDQLRLWKDLEPIATPLSSKIFLTLEGDVFHESNILLRLREYHGNYINMCHRHELLKGFYNGFPDDIKAKILTSKHVTGLESSPSSVRVLCDDGTSYEGDMVIGADGVHSAVRRLMRPLSPKSPPGSSFLSSLLSSGARDGTKPFKSAYRILFGSVPRPEVTPAGSCYESHGTDASAQLFVGEERAWFFVYEKLDKPTRERTLYTQQDADSFAAAHAGLHLAPGLTLAAAYPRRQASGMTDLEEGVLRSWAAGRVVLLGDAVHKVTPNLGLGFNDGVIDLVALVNPLRRLVTGRRAARGGAVPEEALVALFRAYQAERTGLMSTVKDLSAMVTRMSTWATWLDWLLDRHVFPALGADVFLIRRFLGPKLATLPVLDWIEEEFFSQGKIPWKHIPRISQVVVA